MSSPTPIPAGSWPTPITSALIVREAVKLGEVVVDGSDIWWSEARPGESGRSALVRRAADGTVTDVLPPPWNARTRVHEYGGGAWTVSGGVLWFTEFSDQRLYRLEPGGEKPVAVGPEPEVPSGVRHADFRAVPGSDAVVAVRETHAPGDRAADVVNEIVRVAPDGTTEVLVSGPDFVSEPRPSPDGRSLAWLQWNVPDMPWDAAQLVVRAADGTETVVAGGRSGTGRPESVVQPVWGEDGTLWFLADRTDFWSLYRWRPGSDAELVLDARGDIGGPQWMFGASRFALLPGGRVALAVAREGTDRLAVLEPGGELRELDLPYRMFRYVTGIGDGVTCLAGGPATEPVVLQVRADDGTADVLRPARDLGVDPAWFSRPEHVTFPTPEDGSGVDYAHAFLYPPTNPEASLPEGELPPLLVVLHGGPTNATMQVLNLDIQYWTSRGFLVADVDYRGSTGYGRRYRDAMRDRWGITDLDDVVACARFLVEAGRVDPARLGIRGTSAGGFTTLATLCLRPGVFSAGASHFGVADLGGLAADTHKFESRYLDNLVAPWPDRADVYAERSPITHVDKFDTPLAVFQGDEDRIVPPEQAEAIVAALRERRVPHAYLLFRGEQHYFRKAENIRAALDGELSFYAQVWGFELPAEEGITPIQVVR